MIPVVIYHAFPEWIPGGFTGVDIFFVISGFLISGILFRSLETTGRVNYADFYAKRIRHPAQFDPLARSRCGGWVGFDYIRWVDLSRRALSVLVL